MIIKSNVPTITCDLQGKGITLIKQNQNSAQLSRWILITEIFRFQLRKARKYRSILFHSKNCEING